MRLRGAFALVVAYVRGVSVVRTWAAVCCQVAVAVAIACSTAVDAAVIVVGARVGPCVCQPGLSGRFPNV